LPSAERVASHLGCPHFHTTVPIDAQAVHAALAAVLDEPLSDTSLVPMYYLSRMARERVTVVLSGDGGDEAFAGYETYRADRIFQGYRWAPAFLRRALAAVARRMPVTPRKVSATYKARQFFTVPTDDPAYAHFWWRAIFPPEEARRILHPDLRAKAAGPRSLPCLRGAGRGAPRGGPLNAGSVRGPSHFSGR